MALPASVLALVEQTPEEDIVLAILRESFPDVPVHALIADATEAPFLLTRKNHELGINSGDPRFTSHGGVTVMAYTSGIDADEDGALLSDAVRVVMRNAWLNRWWREDLGAVISIKMTESPSRVTDWATSSGPVQYADLPSEWVRYEGSYSIHMRKPRG